MRVHTLVTVAITPDTKDWTWVLQRRCPECGYDAASVDLETLPERIRDNARTWQQALGEEDCRVRPAENVWSPLEYACHVRDVYRVFDERLRLMLTEDDPAYDNWDQDATAVERAYGEQDPAQVAGELADAAEVVAARYASVTADQLTRTGRRSDGAVFTVDTLGRYYLHDVLHHVHDVRS